MRHVLKFILDFLFPPQCSICKTEGYFLCQNCVDHFKIRKISSCFAPLESKKEFTYLDGVIYALDYQENTLIRPAIAQFKYKFTQELADTFGKMMNAKLLELKMIRQKQIVLIPVPLHPKRLRYRGFNQAQCLAKAIAKESGQNVHILNALVRTKHTSQQAKLAKKERHDNLEGAFSLSEQKSLQDQLVENNLDANQSIFFLVDDVCTTGSTLENCAKVLKAEGIKKIYGLVVGRVV